MKRIYTFLAAIILAVTGLSAQTNATRVLADLAKIKGITSVYVSGPMMKLGLSKLSDKLRMENNGISIKGIQNPGGLELVNAEKPELASRLKTAAAGILKGKNTTVLVETKEDGESVNIFSPGKLKNNVIRDLIIEVSEKDKEYTLIYIHGDIEI